MLISFVPENVTFDKVWIRRVTTAMGGSISFSLMDEEGVKGHVYHKPLSMAVARLFIKLYERSKFLKPVPGVITMYDGLVVNAELAPINYLLDSKADINEWTPTVEIHTNQMLMDMHIRHNHKSEDWFFDGTFVYAFNGELQTEVDNGRALDAEAKFKLVSVAAYHFSHLCFSKPEISTRTCLAYQASDGSFAITPPIWTGTGGLGNSNTSDDNDAREEIGLRASFDGIDDVLKVNLNCILYSAKSLSKAFGYKVTYPMGLPFLMLQLRTVNLGAVPKHIKSMYSVNLPFTHFLAWLVGLHNNVMTLEQLIDIRRTLKYLTTKGTIDVNSRKVTSNGRETIHISNVPLFSIEELKKRYDQENKSQFPQN